MAKQLKTVHKSQMQTEAQKIIARAMFLGQGEAREYRMDSKGRRVRVFTRDNPCSEQDVLELIKGVRVFDDIDALEIVGENVLSYMVQKGYVVKNGTFYWITEACAKAYKLPPVRMDGVTVPFIS